MECVYCTFTFFGQKSIAKSGNFLSTFLTCAAWFRAIQGLGESLPLLDQTTGLVPAWNNHFNLARFLGLKKENNNESEATFNCHVDDT